MLRKMVSLMLVVIALGCATAAFPGLLESVAFAQCDMGDKSCGP